MNSTQTVDLHDVDTYFKSRNLVDDTHRPYCLRHHVIRGLDSTEESPLDALGIVT